MKFHQVILELSRKPKKSGCRWTTRKHNASGTESTLGGEFSPPTPSPRSAASLPRFGPLLKNCGCTTVTGIAKGTSTHAPPPPPPIDWNKRHSIRGVGVGVILIKKYGQSPKRSSAKHVFEKHVVKITVKTLMLIDL